MRLKIKELRKEKNFNQQELADKIDISVRMLAEYEKNNSDVGIFKLKKIADVFQVNLFDLIEFEETDLQFVSEPKELYTGSENELIASKNKIIALLEEQKKQLEEENKILREKNKNSA